MKKIIITLIIILTAPSVFSADIIPDPGARDSIIVGYTHADPSGKSAVNINFLNDENLGGIEVVLTWSRPDLAVDSVSFVGSRISYVGIFGYSATANSVVIYGFPVSEPFIAPGYGLLAQVYFHYNYSYSGIPDTSFIDSLTIDDGTTLHSNFFSSSSSEQFIPAFKKGGLVFADVSCCIANRGNIDNSEDDSVIISDLTYLVNYFFQDGPEPVCRFEANINSDPEEQINISDLTFIVNYLFQDGPPPATCP